jgi:predicted Zn-dependent peptidase
MVFGEQIPIEDVIRAIDNVSSEQVLRLANELVAEDAISVTAIGHVA